MRSWRSGLVPLMALVLCAPAPVDAQTRAEVPPVVRALEGAWRGAGTLLGRPGTFTMSWTLGPPGFARLSFTNAWVDESGAPTPVLTAEAVYLVRGDSASGVWIDDRPQRITLESALTDSSLVTRWTAPTERGRTEYVVRRADSVIVRDFVVVNGEERLFAEATYGRP